MGMPYQHTEENLKESHPAFISVCEKQAPFICKDQFSERQSQLIT